MTCDGGFAEKKNNLRAGNARAAGDLDGGTGVGAPSGPVRDPFLALFCFRHVQWLAAPFQHGLLALTAPPPQRGGARYPLVEPVVPCSVWSSFPLDVVSFCARA